MRTRGLNSGRLLPLIVILLTLLHVGVSSASGGKEKKTYIDQGAPKAVAPVPMEGVEPEKMIITTSINPKKVYTFDVYLNRFIVWTEDTSAVIKAIGNRDYITTIKHFPRLGFEVNVNTRNAKIGKQLRDQLRKLPYVDRVENHVYGQSLELVATPSVVLSLYNPSDSVKLKEIADSLNLRAMYDGIIDKGCWQLEIPSGNRLYPTQVIEAILSTGIARYCEPLWDYLSDICNFTYDPYIEQQWGLYNRNNPTRPDANL